MSGWRGKSLWSVSSRFVNAGLAFLLNVLLTRTMSQSDMGLYFLSISVAWGCALICQCGSSILAVKWVAFARAQSDVVLIRRSVWTLVYYTGLQSLLVGIGFVFVPKEFQTKLIWALWTFAVGYQTLIPEILRGFNDIKWASLLGGPIPQLITVAALGILHFTVNTAPFESVASLLIGASFLTSLLGILVVIKRAPFTMNSIPYRTFLEEALPIGMSLAATYVLSQADLWVCGTLLQREDVAVYGIAQRFNVFVSMPLMIFGSVAMPTMAELFATRDINRLREVILKGTFISTGFTFLVLVGGALFAWPAMYYLMGKDYTASYPIFVILGTGQFLHVFVGPNGYLLLLCGEQKVVMVGTIISALLLLVLALIGGKYWGLKGIAVSSAISLTIQSVWMWYQVKVRLKIIPHFRWVKNWSLA